MNTKGTDNPICPHCRWEFFNFLKVNDDYEIGEMYDVLCESCGEEFELQPLGDETFSTWKK